jgi:hypothetical protein
MQYVDEHRSHGAHGHDGEPTGVIIICRPSSWSRCTHSRLFCSCLCGRICMGIDSSTNNMPVHPAKQPERVFELPRCCCKQALIAVYQACLKINLCNWLTDARRCGQQGSSVSNHAMSCRQVHRLIPDPPSMAFYCGVKEATTYLRFVTMYHAAGANRQCAYSSDQVQKSPGFLPGSGRGLSLSVQQTRCVDSEPGCVCCRPRRLKRGT